MQTEKIEVTGKDAFNLKILISAISYKVIITKHFENEASGQVPVLLL